MSDTLDILVKATDLASGTLRKVDAEIDKLGKTAPATGSKWGQAMTAMKSAASSSLGGMLTLAGGVTAVGGAVVATAKFVQGAVNDWAAYNEEVRKLGIATGASEEDLSRMMQAADDVGVSMDAMQTAMRLMAKNGIQPSIDGMATLSDRLLAIEDDTARAEEMSKIFGRGWAEVAGFVLQGGDAIREASAAIEDGLVVTTESASAVREYQENVDALGDSWTAVKNSIASEVIPVLNDLASYYLKTNEEMTKLNETSLVFDAIATEQQQQTRGIIMVNEGYAASMEYMKRVVDEANESLYKGTSRWDAYADAANTTNGIVEDTVKVIDYAELSTRNYSDTLLMAMASTELTAEQTYLLQKNLGMVDNKSTYAAVAMERLNKKLENGFMTVEEYAAAVGALKNNIAGLHDKDVNITVRISEYRQDLSGTGGAKPGQGPKKYPTVGDGVKPIPEKAAGGPVRGGDMYWVGERGPELFVPSQGGQIIPNTQVSNYYNMTVNTNAPSSTVFNDFNLMRAMGA